jgi:hypothetical protein
MFVGDRIIIEESNVCEELLHNLYSSANVIVINSMAVKYEASTSLIPKPIFRLDAAPKFLLTRFKLMSFSNIPTIANYGSRSRCSKLYYCFYCLRKMCVKSFAENERKIKRRRIFRRKKRENRFENSKWNYEFTKNKNRDLTTI